MDKVIAVATQNAQVAEATNNNVNKFNFSFGAETATREYDNVGAYNTLQSMMARNEQLTIQFKTGKDGIIYAWVESARVAGYKYELKNSTYHGIMNYLTTGTVSDFDTNPKESDNLGNEVDFSWEVMKAAIKENKRIQYVPLFRERPDYISAVLPCFKGKVIFRIKRTEEVLNYLRENNQIL